MKKQFKKQLQQETQIIWKNQVHDAKVNPWKVYYTYFEENGKDHVMFYEGKFRSEAVAYFNEIARLQGLKFTGKINSL